MPPLILGSIVTQYVVNISARLVSTVSLPRSAEQRFLRSRIERQKFLWGSQISNSTPPQRGSKLELRARHTDFSPLNTIPFIPPHPPSTRPPSVSPPHPPWHRNRAATGPAIAAVLFASGSSSTGSQKSPEPQILWRYSRTWPRQAVSSPHTKVTRRNAPRLLRHASCLASSCW
jgi:hypothetical protein